MSKCRRCGEQLVIVPKIDEQMSYAHCPECKKQDAIFSQSLKVQFEKGVAEVTMVPTKQFNALVDAANVIYMIFRVFTFDKNRLKKLGNLAKALEPFKEVEDGE